MTCSHSQDALVPTVEHGWQCAVCRIEGLKAEVERLRTEIIGLCDWYDHTSANQHEIEERLDKLREAAEEVKK